MADGGTRRVATESYVLRSHQLKCTCSPLCQSYCTQVGIHMPSNQFYQSSNCFSCRKEFPGKDLKRCGRCRGPLYCVSVFPLHAPRQVAIELPLPRAPDANVKTGRTTNQDAMARRSGMINTVPARTAACMRAASNSSPGTRGTTTWKR